jgi:hypothetical protein
MEPHRYLCSDLVRIDLGGETVITANLEEIWTEGAVLEWDAPIESGTHLTMECQGVPFHATVANNEEHPFGCRVEILFSAQSPWTPEICRPQHLLDPAKVKPADAKQELGRTAHPGTE